MRDLFERQEACLAECQVGARAQRGAVLRAAERRTALIRGAAASAIACAVLLLLAAGLSVSAGVRAALAMTGLALAALFATLILRSRAQLDVADRHTGLAVEYERLYRRTHLVLPEVQDIDDQLRQRATQELDEIVTRLDALAARSGGERIPNRAGPGQAARAR